MEKAVGIIPARYQSTRFPGKALARILGKPVIQWVVEGARQAKLMERIIVATDDERIKITAEKIGAEVVLTSTDHSSGTERVAEVAKGLDTSIIVNIQGDEPLVNGAMLDGLIEALKDRSIPMATLMARVSDLSLLKESHIVKVVVDKNGNALYFSRAPVPHKASDYFLQHIGIYGFQKDFLLSFTRLLPSRLERIEELEQLRVLEHGMKIRMIEVPRPTLSVDTPQDIIRIENFLKVTPRE